MVTTGVKWLSLFHLLTLSLFNIMPRSAWKGPFFVSFPGLKQAVQNGTPIATQGSHYYLFIYYI